MQIEEALGRYVIQLEADGRSPHTIAQARLWREQCRALIAHGRSPAAAKQAEKEARAARATDSVAAFADLWYADVVSRTNSEPRNIRRVLDKDVLPAIGEKPVADVTIQDVLAITDAVKARGARRFSIGSISSRFSRTANL